MGLDSYDETSYLEGMKTFADDLRTMMDAWNKIESTARSVFPGATPEKIYEICKGAMNHALERRSAARVG